MTRDIVAEMRAVANDQFRHGPEAIPRTILNWADHIAKLEAAAEYLAKRVVEDVVRCQLTDDRGEDRCRGKSFALRWEHGFADVVCEHHAEFAENRGALVIRIEEVTSPRSTRTCTRTTTRTMTPERDIAAEMRLAAERRFGDPIARLLRDWADQVEVMQEGVESIPAHRLAERQSERARARRRAQLIRNDLVALHHDIERLLGDG